MDSCRPGDPCLGVGSRIGQGGPAGGRPRTRHGPRRQAVAGELQPPAFQAGHRYGDRRTMPCLSPGSAGRQAAGCLTRGSKGRRQPRLVPDHQHLQRRAGHISSPAPGDPAGQAVDGPALQHLPSGPRSARGGPRSVSDVHAPDRRQIHAEEAGQSGSHLPQVPWPDASQGDHGFDRPMARGQGHVPERLPRLPRRISYQPAPGQLPQG